MDTLFENQYERTKEFHKEIFTYSFFKRPAMMAVYIILAFVFILSILSMIFPGTFPFDKSAGIYICFLLALTAVMIFRYVRTVDINHRRDLEVNNGEAIEMRLILTSDGIEYSRVNSESKNNISFQSVKKIIKTRNYYLLLTEANQYVVFKQDGFVRGTSEEFLSFLNAKVIKSPKKSKKQITLIGLACVAALGVAAVLYVTNGRTIFENRSEPSAAELEKIHNITAFEQEKLSECAVLLSRYDERLEELGIEIKPVLDQTRAVNNQGLVEKHDWNEDLWLPKFYNSKIICYVYKDGQMLENWTSSNSVSFFVEIYWLLYAGKNEETTINESPFDHFDSGMDNLLDRVSDFLQK